MVYHVGSQLIDPASESDGWLPSLLVVCGPAGSGKSHLLRLLVAGLQRQFATVPFPSVADWSAAAKQAARHRGLRQVAPWQDQRLLVLDDIHQLADQVSAQRRLVALIDEFQQTDGLVILSCREAPWMTGLQSGLISRLSGGLLVPLLLPGFHTRLALIDDQVRRSGWLLSNDGLRWLAQQLQGTPRTIQQQLTSLMSKMSPGEPISLATLKRHRPAEPNGSDITPKNILVSVSREFGLTTKDLTGRARRRTVVTARAIAIHLIRTHTGCSLEEIGRQVGNRDHSTVLNALRRAEQQLESDSSLRHIVETITSVLRHANDH